MPKLVIVESPAKAKTIARILGAGYRVEASFGHVRDLPENADEIPAAVRSKPWARLGVDVERDFAPVYVVPRGKQRHVAALREAAKDADELLLATDEDREGESISWHVLQLLSKPPPARRIVFHEITPEAIHAALANPRAVDENLVRAQETRRILDRLYGYTLSPLLWKKVAPKLSAGRVQSVAVRLCVQRERERRDFRIVEYWSLAGRFRAAAGEFDAESIRLDGRKIATGKGFDSTGNLADERLLWLDAKEASALVAAWEAKGEWSITKVDTSPVQEKPPPPFMTSTLQQEANRKLRMSSKQCMAVAQQLYEGIDMEGERVGLITYMRTDSLHLAERAVEEARQVIAELYGADYLPPQPNRYKSKIKNAQEAHEAIRPTVLTRRPASLERHLNKEQLALYELIWKRAIACQMKPARVLRTSVEVEGRQGDSTLAFGANGRQIEFPGFLRAYVEGSDDPDAALDQREAHLPALSRGERVDLTHLDRKEHRTQPPARYTEASLVKKLEEEGIGRPSTYASIIGTIQDRGYVFKRGNELVPTFTAFAVTELLEQHFDDLVDLKFTARMEDQLDEIAKGSRDAVSHLREFFSGMNGHAGLEEQVRTRATAIPYPALPLGTDPATQQPVVVKVGRFGCYVQRAEGGAGNTASLPDDMPPAELTLERALELLLGKTLGPSAVAVDPGSGRCVFLRSGRFGNYLEVDSTDEEKAAKAKPKRVSIPKGVDPSSLEEADFARLLALPRSLGTDPSTGQEVLATLGAYGAYVKRGEDTRNLAEWRDVFDIDLEAATKLLAEPRTGKRGGRTATEPILELGVLEGAAGPVRVMPGRFGPYVTDGAVNATLPKGLDPATVTAERAIELLRERAASAPRRGARRTTRRRA